MKQQIRAFSKLGEQLREGTVQKGPFSAGLSQQIKLSGANNPWFTEESIRQALSAWGEVLTEKKLAEWASRYKTKPSRPKTVAIVLAGNVPLVGFHDFLTVLMAGHRALVKQSSKDKHLLPYLAEYLTGQNPGFKNRIAFTENKLTGFDAVIATGSDNTARYFEYYFGKYPHIIRRNRNSVAVLTGDESEDELEALGKDIFSYFGLGCRNVSKIFIPEGYDTNRIFNAVYPWRHVIDHNKYANNYDYHKALYLMKQIPFLDNGFLLLMENSGYASPVAMLYYEKYSSVKKLNVKLQKDNNQIQCIVSKGFTSGEILFGKTQQPELWDYADKIDTFDFLLHL